MQHNLNEIVRENVIIDYLYARSSINAVICCSEDPDTTDVYLYHHLRTAAYLLTSCVLEIEGCAVPDKLVSRIHAVNRVIAPSRAPRDMFSLVSTSPNLPRVQMGAIAQVLDCWAVMLQQKYPDVLRNLSCGQHSAMVACC